MDKKDAYIKTLEEKGDPMNKKTKHYAIMTMLNDKEVLSIDEDCVVKVNGKVKYKDDELKEVVRIFCSGGVKEYQNILLEDRLSKLEEVINLATEGEFDEYAISIIAKAIRELIKGENQ